MIFSEEILLSLGADILQNDINEIIFSDGQKPNYYYQIGRGAVKLTKEREKGTEAIFSISFSGECFAETFLFTNKAHPFNAVTMEECTIFKVPGKKNIEFVKNSHETLLNLYFFNAERMYYRFVMLNCLSINDSLLS